MSYLPPPVPPPTQAEFQTYFYAQTGIPNTVIPTDSVYFGYAYNVALTLVNQKLILAGVYNLAVYNLGTDNLINWAPPSSPAVLFPTNNPDGTEYMTYLRQQYGSLQFTPGVIATAGDESTSAAYTMLEQYKGYTLGNLQNLKTPWGRTYIALAASVGPTLQGLS